MVTTLLLFPTDNVLVLTRSVAAGETIRVNELDVVVPEALGLGHKIAAGAIAKGSKILKYGAPIGSATKDIAAGEHVHLHNMRSDYLPTYTLEPGRAFHSTP